MRVETLSLKRRDVIAASRLHGTGPRHIIFHDILPNALGSARVSVTQKISDAILTETGLSFLGLGVPPPTTS